MKFIWFVPLQRRLRESPFPPSPRYSNGVLNASAMHRCTWVVQLRGTLVFLLLGVDLEKSVTDRGDQFDGERLERTFNLHMYVVGWTVPPRLCGSEMLYAGKCEGNSLLVKDRIRHGVWASCVIA
jgi:hypothetical protein